MQTLHASLLSALTTSLLLFSGVTLSSNAMDISLARHLLSRTSFGSTPAEIQQIAKLDYQEAVDKLLASINQKAVTNPPSWVHEKPPHPKQRKTMNKEQKQEFRKLQRQRGMELKKWWYKEMITTDSPLTEKLTLFWHNHFTSELKKVKWPPLMYRQNLLLRQYAGGNFRDFVHAIARDAAMTLYLDNQKNKRGKPNENFARELLELFTLGEGNYTEADIKEGARAFTGWQVNRKTGVFFVNKKVHDHGAKMFIGATGNWDGKDIIEIVLKQPRVAEFITEKMWREFISDTPDKAAVHNIASIFRKSNYEIKTLLKALLSSDQFMAQENRGSLIKSPVELMVGTIRTFDISISEYQFLVQQGRMLGQDILDPPNVAGWPGGTVWINSHTLLARKQVVNRLLREKQTAMKNMSTDGSPMGNRLHPEDGVSIAFALLPGKPVQAEEINQEKKRYLLRLVSDPVYQLK